MAAARTLIGWASRFGSYDRGSGAAFLPSRDLPPDERWDRGERVACLYDVLAHVPGLVVATEDAEPVIGTNFANTVHIEDDATISMCATATEAIPGPTASWVTAPPDLREGRALTDSEGIRLAPRSRVCSTRPASSSP
jgi:hypothetical protein